MVTIEQIKAARALLGWSQGELAKHAGLSQTGIARIEIGTQTPTITTLQKIQLVFEANGIEFIEGGVRKSKDRLLVIEGDDSLARLQNDIFTSLEEDKDDEVCLLGIVEIGPEEEYNYKKTQEQVKRLQEINKRERILIEEGTTNFIAPKSWYRYVPKAYFSTYTVYIYANKIALLLRNSEPKVLLFENPFFAETMKITFNFVWDHAQKVEE